MNPRPPSTIVLAFAIALLTGCVSERSLQVNDPAEVTMPAAAKHVVLVDRTKPRSGFTNAIEGALSKEGFQNDAVIGMEMNRTLERSLGTLGIYEVAVDPGRYAGSGSGKLPEPFSWEEIEAFAALNDADVVVALEALDADVRLNRSEREVTETRRGVALRSYTEHIVRRTVTARFGWRVYDRRRHIIIDMYTDRSTTEDEHMARADRPSETGRAQREAERGLPRKDGVMLQLGNGGAQRFAQRFVPTTSVVHRRYFSGGEARLKAADKLFDRGDREGAIAIWQEMLADPKVKLRGKACYNIAVAYELMGELGKARDHAARAYNDFGNKWGRSYAGELEARIKNEARAQEENARLGGAE